MADLEILMAGYQRADSAATTVLIRQVSPLLFKFFASDYTSRPDAEDLLQDTWLQIHRARHTYRPGEPVLPWMFAIARHVKVDGFRRSQRIRSREQTMSAIAELPASIRSESTDTPDFATLIADLPSSQREVVSMLKLSGMSLEEVARATASSVGSVKLKAHRAYEKLRTVLKRPASARPARSGDVL